jgi:multicomponent Na+:H+ antiporter subunit B
MSSVAEKKGMTLIVKTATRLTLPFILLFGAYLSLRGEAAPGGGFVGGIIIALALIQVMLAFGKEVALRKIRAYVLRFMISAASLTFLYIVMAAPGSDVLRFVMPFCESIIVAAAIFTIFVALVLVSKHD